MFFYWERAFDGSWRPAMSADRPKPKKGECQAPKFAGVVELKSPEDTFDLDSLAELYPLKETANA